MPDPFASLDPDGVGELIKTAITAARRVNPAIKLGICGEHGGDPASIELCERLGPGLRLAVARPRRPPGRGPRRRGGRRGNIRTYRRGNIRT